MIARKNKVFTVWAERECSAGYMQVGIPILARSKWHARRVWKQQAEEQRQKLFEANHIQLAVQLNFLTGRVISIEEGGEIMDIPEPYTGPNPIPGAVI